MPSSITYPTGYNSTLIDSVDQEFISLNFGYNSTLITLSNDDLITFQRGFNGVLLGVPVIFEFRVVDTSDNPIPNAAVIFSNPITSDTYTLYTDAQGIVFAEPFAIINVAPSGLISSGGYQLLNVIADKAQYVQSALLQIDPNTATQISYTIVLEAAPVVEAQLIRTEYANLPCDELYTLPIAAPLGWLIAGYRVENRPAVALPAPVNTFTLTVAANESRRIIVNLIPA